ncbi:N-acetylmuramoyl-L-alanine amidase family protein [Winogradskyella aurantiaca]|uniref:N-acetylmuramoyl-L-alanine amidase family protein n=1 Tax=Winogradskyella aurantiaca TaxID=2219558 RepID=UPI000E1D0D88|nr:N-acetylmuramoyl-L-alanine amidase [Winogradskyella aurantiaca]
MPVISKTFVITYYFKSIVCFCLSFSIGLTSLAVAQSDSSEFVVVLDAGHGGGDPGNLGRPGSGYKEKNIALAVTLAVGKELSKDPNVEVIYTRDGDYFLELIERAEIANKADADLFVSIHCNSHSSSAYGTETFVLGVTNSARNMAIAKKENEVIFLEENYEKNYGGFDPNSPESSIAIGIEQEIYVEQSIQLARKIEDNFNKGLKRKSRGIKQASLWVMHNTYMPSVLVELGFLTNKSEGAFLNSKKGQSKMATAIKDAIIDYKRTLDENVGESFYVAPNDVETVEPTIASDVSFKVQLAASSKKLETKPYNFKGLGPISRMRSGNLYKYFYGNTNSYDQAMRLKAEARDKGYSTAYVVAFKAGQLVSLESVLKSESN